MCSASMLTNRYAQLHQDGVQTPEFAEEIDKLMPHFGPGSGAWYSMLRKH